MLQLYDWICNQTKAKLEDMTRIELEYLINGYIDYQDDKLSESEEE